MIRGLDVNGAGVRSLLCRTALCWVVAAGCSDDLPPAMVEAAVRPLPDSAALTLSMDDEGGAWLGEPGRLLRVGEDGVEVVHILPRGAAPRVVGRFGERLHLLSGDSLRVIPAPDSGGVRGGLGNAVLVSDPGGRFVLQGTRSGAVLAHDVHTLDPIWAWGASGGATTALAFSPEGDRVYQALHAEDEAPHLLIRDLQTGRSLAVEELPAPFEALVPGAGGLLYGAGRDGDRIVVTALQVRGDGASREWSRELSVAGDGAPSIGVARNRVVVWGEGVRWGLVALDGGTGELVARARVPPVDVAIDSAGGLWALYPGVLRRLE